ncbi:TrbG/VirB9 family P-type conjugative transfer protein [Brevundimonas diminuta]|uniref:TrbG/VirB9 family P-type conjugative transfer protein n=1 Tax=Brevundimonas diminuta TaxID=293 RepID=UPI0028A73B55|nr:TrbG/VirB9 family P-type conjugative transfer protein [Brevundimonas diminuta]
MKPLLLAAALLCATPALAETPPDAAADPRVRTLVYQADQVVPLTVAANYQLTVIFDPAERVENVAVGDAEAWQITLNKRGDALFLKSLRAGAATNMTVITDARVYNFELSSAYGLAPDAPFTVRFAPAERADAERPELQPDIGRYRLSGARALRPSSISDDGLRTYIEWRPRQTLPVVFAIDERGDEILLDGHMRDGRYVVDAVHPALLFRLERQSARAERLRVRTSR